MNDLADRLEAAAADATILGVGKLKRGDLITAAIELRRADRILAAGDDYRDHIRALLREIRDDLKRSVEALSFWADDAS